LHMIMSSNLSLLISAIFTLFGLNQASQGPSFSCTSSKYEADVLVTRNIRWRFVSLSSRIFPSVATKISCYPLAPFNFAITRVLIVGYF
jgi:hypothetical protein